MGKDEFPHSHNMRIHPSLPHCPHFIHPQLPRQQTVEYETREPMNRKMIFFTEGHTLSAPGAIDKFWPRWLNGFLKWWATVGNKSHTGQRRLMFLMMHFQSSSAPSLWFPLSQGRQASQPAATLGKSAGRRGRMQLRWQARERTRGTRDGRESGDCWELCQSV